MSVEWRMQRSSITSSNSRASLALSVARPQSSSISKSALASARMSLG